MDNKWTTIPSQEILEKTAQALEQNGIHVVIVENGEEAKKKFFEILPQGVSIMNNSSVTLDQLGIAQEIMESGKYDSVKKQLMGMDRKTQSREMQVLGAAPEWTSGSVHAVTQTGSVLIASNSGSQIPGYTYGSDHIIWVVGAQKIVKDVDEGIKRIYEHSLPLEDERAQKAYGRHSFPSKILIYNRESNSKRTTMILVKEKIGF